MLNTGIYQIKNKQTGRIYIGSTNNFKKRKDQHFSELRKGRHVNRKLQTDFNTFGEDAFEFNIVEYTWRNRRLEREQFHINRVKDNMYNTGVAKAVVSKTDNLFVAIRKQITRFLKEKFL